MENRATLGCAPAFQPLLRSGDKGTLEAQQKAGDEVVSSVTSVPLW